MQTGLYFAVCYKYSINVEVFNFFQTKSCEPFGGDPISTIKDEQWKLSFFLLENRMFPIRINQQNVNALRSRSSTDPLSLQQVIKDTVNMKFDNRNTMKTILFINHHLPSRSIWSDLHQQLTGMLIMEDGEDNTITLINKNTTLHTFLCTMFTKNTFFLFSQIFSFKKHEKHTQKTLDHPKIAINLGQS